MKEIRTHDCLKINLTMSSENTVLLSTAYLGPVQYYTKLSYFSNVLLEQHENFNKQTYRNRCTILGANGLQPLVIPVTKGRRMKAPIREMKISYEENWQRVHWKAIVSAYNNSPYFEYYEFDLHPFFHQKKHEFLFDFNLKLQEVICELLEIEPSVSFTEEYIVPGTTNIPDYRSAIHPKQQAAIPDPHFKAQKYTQVFSEKFDFVPNLSILDLLFNEGPNAANVLENSYCG